MNYEPTINHYEQKIEKARGEKALQMAKQITKQVSYFPQGYSPTWQKMKENLNARMEAKAEAITAKPVKKKEGLGAINRKRAIELYQSGKSVTEIVTIMDFSRIPDTDALMEFAKNTEAKFNIFLQNLNEDGKIRYRKERTEYEEFARQFSTFSDEERKRIYGMANKIEREKFR